MKITNSNRNSNYRSKWISVVLQPKMDCEFFNKDPSHKEINVMLRNTGFPLHTEVSYALSQISALSASTQEARLAEDWAFGSETSRVTNIPHYQIYLKFPCIVTRTSVFHAMKKYFEERVHIATETAYNDKYIDYCTKLTSNFGFESNHYWNKKISKAGINLSVNLLVKLRPKLKMIQDKPLTGQKLMLSIAKSIPDDRTLVWIADVIGGTGKTTALQSIVNDKKYKLISLRISDGLERLSAKLRKKIRGRLDRNEGYPNSIWLNFGRTVTENNLKTFADFGEQILDGMLDDNFGNTGNDDFEPLPYVNLIVTANTPPNLRQLTTDRIKLLTLFPIYDENDELLDSLLIPIYVEIRVRFIKAFPYDFEYKYIIKPAKEIYYSKDFSKFSWYPELLENIEAYDKYEAELEGTSKSFKLRMSTDWIPGKQHTVQDDVNAVHRRALSYSTTLTGEGSQALFVEASSYHEVFPFSYHYNNKDRDKRDYQELKDDRLGDEIRSYLEEDKNL